MSSKRSFKDLKIWQLSEEIFEMICEDVKKWPKTKVASAISYQLLDSGGSMGGNIAEGYGRGGPREFEQFTRYARGSMAETDSWLYKAMRQKLITQVRYGEYGEKFEQWQKMAASLIYKLRGQSKRKSRAQ